MKSEAQEPGEMKRIFSSAMRGFMLSDVLCAGFELGVFECVGKHQKEEAEIIKALKLDRRGGEILLNALAATGFLHKNKSKYKLTPMSERFLLAASPEYMGNAVHHNIHVKRSWINLAGSVKKGVPAPRPECVSEKENIARQRAFILAMDDHSKEAAARVAEELDLTGVRQLIDIGGGPGTYSFAIVRKKPDIEACIFDLPVTIPITRECIQKNDLEHFVGTVEGDFTVDDIGYGFDLALMGSIIHIFGPSTVKKMIKKAVKALNPGGRVVIKDWFMDDTRTEPVGGALFAVNMLVNTDDGNTYTEAEVREWMAEAGLKEIKRLDVPPDVSLLIGKKPAAEKKTEKPTKKSIRKIVVATKKKSK